MLSPFHEAVNQAAVGNLAGLQKLFDSTTASEATAIQKVIDSAGPRGKQVPFIKPATNDAR